MCYYCSKTASLRVDKWLQQIQASYPLNTSPKIFLRGVPENTEPSFMKVPREPPLLGPTFDYILFPEPIPCGQRKARH